MSPADWIKFFKELPETEHEMVIISLKNGAEVAAQRFMKFFDHFMVVRGRLGGTDDGGRIFCLPYAQMDFVFFSRIQSDETVVKMFGDIIGGIKREYLITEEEEEAQKAAAKAEAEAAAGAEPEDGALPAVPKGPAPANVSALRSRLLQNRSKRVDPRTRG